MSQPRFWATSAVLNDSLLVAILTTSPSVTELMLKQLRSARAMMGSRLPNPGAVFFALPLPARHCCPQRGLIPWHVPDSYIASELGNICFVHSSGVSSARSGSVYSRC